MIGEITFAFPGKRAASAMNDDMYPHVLHLVLGNFSVPVRERLNVHRAATTYFTRNRNMLSVDGDPSQLFRGKR